MEIDRGEVLAYILKKKDKLIAYTELVGYRNEGCLVLETLNHGIHMNAQTLAQ